MENLKNKLITLNSNLEFEKIDNSIILFDIEKKKMVTFNETAGVIIELLREPVFYSDFFEKFKFKINFGKTIQEEINIEVEKIILKMIDEEILIMK